MKMKFLIKEPWPRIIGIPLLAVLIVFLSDSSGDTFLYKFLISLLFVTVMWNGDYYILMGFRKIYPNLNITLKRIIFTLISICIFNISADFLICFFMNFCNVEGFDNYFETIYDESLIRNFITTLIIVLLYESGYFFEKWKKQTIETEQVKSQQIRSELIVLKNQISPHFLFNSLNTLVTLIDENPILASKFTEKLSQVYRYILKYKDKEIVKLKTELKFIHDYSYLLKMRFEKSLTITISIDSEAREQYVAPLTIQMLVENAVKHNIVSISKPLMLDIYVENGKTLVVKNNLQRRSKGVNSLNTGLENIKQRYKLLGNRAVDVIETREHFLVAIPLLEIMKEHEYASL